jgi:hypothetical protein
MATILAVGRLLLFALLGTAQLQSERGYATRFGSKDDLLAGGTMACTGKRMQQNDLICAHRTLPCGTVVLVHSVRTQRWSTCVVADRGPYGATLPNGEIVLKVKPSDEGVWRTLIDLSPAVAEALDLNGRERVVLVHERPGRRRALQRWSQAGGEKPRPNQTGPSLALTP